MAGPRVSDGERARLRELHERGLSCNEIARLLGRSASTVSRLAREDGLSFERGEQTEAAARAKRADAAEKRARLQDLLLDDALRLREQLWQRAKVYNFGGKDNTYAEEWLEQPDFAGQATILRAVGIAIDKAIKLAEQDRATSGDADADGSLLADVVDALRAKYADEEGDDAETAE